MDDRTYPVADRSNKTSPVEDCEEKTFPVEDRESCHVKYQQLY